MMNLAIVVNGDKILDYDRNKRLPGRQRRFLDEMDAQMQADGFAINGQQIVRPNALQQAQYVTSMLIGALVEDKEALAAATCAWLATRLPELQQVKTLLGADQETRIELVFDRSFDQSSLEQPITFVTRPRTH
ncbi:MAG: hypothetical protein ACFCUG_00260 [Thiotrichales bacterium]